MYKKHQQNPWGGGEMDCQTYHITIVKMSSIQQKITRHAKMWASHKKINK